SFRSLARKVLESEAARVQAPRPRCRSRPRAAVRADAAYHKGGTLRREANFWSAPQSCGQEWRWRRRRTYQAAAAIQALPPKARVRPAARWDRIDRLRRVARPSKGKMRCI